MSALVAIWAVIGLMMALGVVSSILGIRWAGGYAAHAHRRLRRGPAVRKAPDEADLDDLRAARTAADVLTGRR